MCTPIFHKLLYKLLTTLCVVLDCAPPNQKVFPMPLCDTLQTSREASNLVESFRVLEMLSFLLG